MVRLDQDSTLTFPESEESDIFGLDAIQGVFNIFSRDPRHLKVNTPYLNAAVEGTEFLVQAAPKESRVLVFEGVVSAENQLGRLLLRRGEGAVAGPGQAPTKVLIAEPRDAVKWALFYPPVTHFSGKGMGPEIRDALDRFKDGDSTAALAALERVPTQQRDARFFGLRASIFLYVGQVEPAQNDLSRALALDAADGNAIALRSIVALVLDKPQEAVRFAEEGARLAPAAAAPQIALSYVHQSQFDLDGAWEDAKTATELEPDNALAWARRAELELARDNLDAALRAAKTSTGLNAHLSRTQTTFGFAQLLRFDAAAATKSFKRAIELDQVDPLPRLGLGIALTRQGRLRDGSRNMEIAAALDPDKSILRSYLGKAYYDEKRDELAARQFGLAKILDPKDPTPWFYDAIREQTENRPVEALDNLQQSIERNDNRAVYRSSLLLDSDLAARSAGQARIYEDLGFPRRALVEGWISVNADPGNWSAHRLLADTYARRPRRNAARVSEMFQALMYQPINILPLQPQRQESSLPILVRSGPTDVGIDEFNPLFIRNGINLLVDGALGNNNTWGDSLVVYGLHDRFSGSLGQFHYQTDGFRVNNDQDDDIYNAFAQVALNPSLSLQAEYRHRKAEQGDLALNFDPEDFSRTFRRRIDQDTARLGVRLRATPSSELLLSAISGNQDEHITDEDEVFPVEIDTDISAVQGEGQYLFRGEGINLIVGGIYNDISQDSLLGLDLSALFGERCPAFSPIPCEGIVNLDARHGTGYLYANISMPAGFLWTLGYSYDDLDYENLDFGKRRGYPKLGVQWDITDTVQVRAAYFEFLKPKLVVEQTLQPTQVAGFSQFFDDPEATESEVYGFGIDTRLIRDVMLGLEVTHRDVVGPLFFPLSGEVEFWERTEDAFLGYAYWTPTNRLALSVHYEYEDVSSDLNGFFGLGPALVRTRSLPMQIRYFDPTGFFGGLTGTFVDQTVRDTPLGFDREDESFWVVDLELGYRLPKRRGILSLEIRNLLDESFLYQDRNFLAIEPVPARYIPDRSIVGKISLSFDALFGGRAN
jgi:tetratricopeptide (TPR) repeat protein